MKFNSHKFSIALSIFMLGVAISCTDPDDFTESSVEGGLIVPVKPNLSYRLASTTSLDVAVTVPEGPGIQSLKVYKSFCKNCGDDNTRQISNEILTATLSVDGENVTEPTVASMGQTYAQLIEGLTIDGEGLPTDETELNFGDNWRFRYVSIMEDGRELINNNGVTVYVANAYSGEYFSEGYFSHPSSPRAINRAKTLVPINLNTVETEYGDLGSSGWKMWLQVNEDNSVTVIPKGSANTGTVPSGPNSYDPTTKTFTLNYQYSGGTRVITEVLSPVED
jgi:hypothetical protein